MADEQAVVEAAPNAAPAPGPETNDGGGVDWEGMSDSTAPGQDDEPDSDLEPAPASDPAEDAEEPDSPAPKPTTKEPDPKPAETPIQPPALPEQTPEAAAAAQAALDARFAEWEKAQTANLTKAYGFDEDTASRLQTEPELVLPELAAKMHMSVMKQVIETVQRMMPQMTQQTLAQTSTESKATDFFYGINNDLNPSVHHDQVLKAGRLFREMNPKATPEEAAKGIGAIVRASTGLTTAPAAKTPEAPAPKPVAKRAPHRPLAAGSSGGTAKAPAVKSAWDDLVDD